MNEQIQFPNINLSVSGYDSEILRGSHARPQEPGMQEKIGYITIRWTINNPK